MTPDSPSNLLIIVSDQHNKSFLGCEAGGQNVQTPALDALAQRGAQFKTAYCNSPICVPSRASLTTGAYVHEIGYWDNAIAYDGRVKGWPHAVSEAGYTCVSIGKLHFKDQESPAGFQEQILPMHIMDGIGMVWGSVRDPLPVRDGGELIVSMAGPGETEYTRYDRAVTEQACAWLKERGRDLNPDPWCLYVGLLAPHPPYVAPPEYFSLYADQTLAGPVLHPETGWTPHPWVRQFMDVVPGIDRNTQEERERAARAYMGLCSFLDANVGRILGALDHAGLTNSTRVIYTSDHGDMVGERGQWNKSMPYDASAAVPLIVAGPDITPGSRVRTPASLIDLHPTVLDALNIEAADDGIERPGRSLFDIARHDDDPTRVVFSEYHAYGAISAWYMVRKGRFKLIWFEGFDPELYDLESDPNETVDLSQSSEHQTTRLELEAALKAIVDPSKTDQRAKSDQRRLIARHGGPQAALAVGTKGATPPPKINRHGPSEKIS